MVIMGGVDVIEGDKLEILGRIYVLDIGHNLAGDFVVWVDENSFMRIYATPNVDGIEGVSIQLDYEWCNIDTDSREVKIESYDHYKQIVKELVENMLKNLPMCKYTCDVDLESHPPIDVKGWDFDLCGCCHQIIKKGMSIEKVLCVEIDKRVERYENRKCLLTKERVLEEINEMVDKYFEEKSQEIKIDYSDISVDQCVELNNVIERLADIVIKWAEQNK